MLADVLDGTLSAADQAVFDLHVAGCPSCTAMLADARRGASLLEVLAAVRPEPSAALLDRIFAQTTGAAAISAQAIAQTSETSAAQPVSIQSGRHPNTLLGVPARIPALNPAAASAGNVLPFRQRVVNALRFSSIGHALMQPRLAMTAAMAFFSVALTLNLTGLHITELRAKDLKPSSIRRSFYETNARLARTFDNMRVVYEFTSRVHDLQRSAENTTPAPAPSNQNDSAPSTSTPSGDKKPDGQKPDDSNDPKQARPRPKSGTSRREIPQDRLQFVGSLSGRGSTPAATYAFAPLAPNVFRNQEGGLV